VIDVLGRPLVVGARVAVAFSYSRASVGHLRIGTIESMDDEHSIVMSWEDNNGKLSPKMKYGAASRWIRL
jgi:hypothetical protein